MDESRGGAERRMREEEGWTRGREEEKSRGVEEERRFGGEERREGDEGRRGGEVERNVRKRGGEQRKAEE